MSMKRLFLCIIVVFIALAMRADKLSVFQKYAQEADTAYKNGDTNLCFKINEDIISLFNSTRKKNVKNDEICTIVFNAYCSLSILDKRKNEKEVCDLLSNGLALIDSNPSWVKTYLDKHHIITCFVNLIGGYSKLGDIESACTYNQKMVTFAENHYRFEIADVLLTACDMYSGMNLFDNNYPLYQKLYEMLDDLDRLQQYKVVRELIHFEFRKENYAELVNLALKHEKLIAKSKDKIKETVLYIISSGFNYNANKIARENQGKYLESIDNSYKIGCDWALRNDNRLFPMNCIDYAYWLYGFDEYKDRAIEQFRLYLKAVESAIEDDIFDKDYRRIEDAENALVSILIQEIVNSSKPKDLNTILSEYPKIVSAIIDSPNSEYYDDFIKVVDLSKEICYGTK